MPSLSCSSCCMPPTIPWYSGHKYCEAKCRPIIKPQQAENTKKLFFLSRDEPSEGGSRKSNRRETWCPGKSVWAMPYAEASLSEAPTSSGMLPVAFGDYIPIMYALLVARRYCLYIMFLAIYFSPVNYPLGRTLPWYRGRTIAAKAHLRPPRW